MGAKCAGASGWAGCARCPKHRCLPWVSDQWWYKLLTDVTLAPARMFSVCNASPPMHWQWPSAHTGIPCAPSLDAGGMDGAPSIPARLKRGCKLQSPDGKVHPAYVDKYMQEHPELQHVYNWVACRQPQGAVDPSNFGSTFMKPLAQLYPRTAPDWLKLFASHGGLLYNGERLSVQRVQQLTAGSKWPWECMLLDPAVLHKKLLLISDDHRNVHVRLRFQQDSRGYPSVRVELPAGSWRALKEANAARGNLLFTAEEEPNIRRPVPLSHLLCNEYKKPQLPLMPGTKLQANHYFCEHVERQGGVPPRASGLCVNCRHMCWGTKRSNALDFFVHVHVHLPTTLQLPYTHTPPSHESVMAGPPSVMAGPHASPSPTTAPRRPAI